MFGTNEEQGLSLVDRQKMKLVAGGYKDSTMFFKMFFDKWYRRERYDAIVNRVDEYKNINEFRTMILHNYATMPLAPTRNLYVLYPKDNGKEDPSEVVESSSEERDDNVLLERQYLKTYWHYFRVSMGVQGILAGCVMYGGATIYMGNFKGSVMRAFCGVGIVLHGYAMYLKRVKMDDY